MKKILSRIANRIIDKYGIHYLKNDSIISLYDYNKMFKITSWHLDQFRGDINRLEIKSEDLTSFVNMNIYRDYSD
jgi:hypothetical protein